MYLRSYLYNILQMASKGMLLQTSAVFTFAKITYEVLRHG